MIIGVHTIIYSNDAEADRAFFKDVLGLKGVDVGRGWLIFKAPPAEIAVHPAEESETHEMYLMCDDVKAEVEALKAKGIKCGPVNTRPYGIVTDIKLPGGGVLGMYQPTHKLAIEL